MERLQFCDYHNMVVILEKGEFNSDFHPMVDFIEASPLRYALTVKPNIFVSHIQQFWSTATIETTDVGTHILATVDGIQRTAQEEEIGRLKERVQVLEDREAVASKPSGEDAPIKGSNNEGEAAAERISNDSEEIARVLTSMDAATVLAGETNVPTAGPPATVISTGSEVGPTASPIVRRRKEKEVMVESNTPKKKKLQE
nr:ribonuclease H-like domain, reverse transcriptase, RNA-dependent DNA polymerase [Tanacetum cinerariifolium]